VLCIVACRTLHRVLQVATVERPRVSNPASQREGSYELVISGSSFCPDQLVNGSDDVCCVLTQHQLIPGCASFLPATNSNTNQACAFVRVCAIHSRTHSFQLVSKL